MSSVLCRILNMSVFGGILILAVILLRLLFRRIPRRIFIIAWILVMIRLVCPFSIPNELSPLPEDLFAAGRADTGIEDHYVLPGSRTESIDGRSEEGQTGPADPAPASGIYKGLYVLWIAGIAAILAKACIKTVKLRRKVSNAVSYRENVYLCPDIRSSFILGFARPGIYIPSSAGSDQLRYIIDHEKQHIAGRDHVVKLLFYIIAAVHWFNPLCHIAFRLFSEDLEMACDERTIARRDAQYRANYMQTLLDCGMYSTVPGAGTLSFGSIGIKRRVERIMNNKKTGKVTIAAFAAVCAALVFFLMTGNAAAADVPEVPEDFDETKYTVIRDAGGEIVEAFNTSEPEHLEPPRKTENKGAHTDPQFGSLAEIREEVLRNGVFRSSAKQGDPVFAVSEGTVVSAKFESPYGHCVTVKDAEGRTWKYGHCSELIAKEGVAVKTGDLIAYAGSSGITPGPAVIIKIVK